MTAKILIVEDNPDNMKLIRWMLEDAGYLVVGVDTAEAGLQLLEERQFDLVVMDISLPSMDGKEATRRLRAQKRFETLPIVAVTASVAKDEVSSVEASGVTAVISKPIEEQEFLQLVARSLQSITA
jgi:two-component system, cell cycle response regulator DivK